MRPEGLWVQFDSMPKVDVKKEFEKDSISEHELIEKIRLKRKKEKKVSNHTKQVLKYIRLFISNDSYKTSLEEKCFFKKRPPDLVINGSLESIMKWLLNQEKGMINTRREILEDEQVLSSILEFGSEEEAWVKVRVVAKQ